MKCSDCPFLEQDSFDGGYTYLRECRWDDHSLGSYYNEIEFNSKNIFYNNEENIKRREEYEKVVNQECSLDIVELEKVIDFFSKIIESKKSET